MANIDGNNQDNVLVGTPNDDRIRGFQGDDELFGNRGEDTLRGGAHNDELFGSRGPDHLFGGGNDDELSGGRGDDELTGGNGNDQFFYDTNEGDDTILDFQGAAMTGGDAVILENVNRNQLDAIDGADDVITAGVDPGVTNVGGDLVIDFGATGVGGVSGDTLTLVGIGGNNLDTGFEIFGVGIPI